MEKRRDGKIWAEVGGMWIASPPVPTDKSVFLNGHVTNKKDQRWERDFPSDEQVELLARGSEERKALRRREVERRKNGVWFFNNGDPTYLTGIHYFYLSHYLLTDGNFPSFRDVDQEFFWWWDAIEKDPHCFGGVFVTRRQQGKTSKASAIILEHTTRVGHVHNGIQSKSEKDAKDIFTDFIVPQWRAMTPLLRPKTNLASSDPKTELLFRPRAVWGAKGAATKPEAALHSKVDYRNAKDNAYDGRKLTRYLSDEVFKDQDGDPKQRWSIVRKMFKQQGKVIAKSLHTSTIEEKGDTDAQRAREMWADADPSKKLANGETMSGLWRLFQPAYKGYIMDAYGRSNIEASKRDLDATREALQDRPEELLKFNRANPYTIEEALRTSGKASDLNMTNIHNALDWLANLDRPPYVRVDLVWGDDAQTWVKTEDNPNNGRFLFASRAIPALDMQNRVRSKGTKITRLGLQTVYEPLNDINYGVSSDPIDKTKTVEGGSDFAGHAARKRDIFVEANRWLDEANGVENPEYWPTDSIIVEYLCRPTLPRIAYEDLLKLCHFLGCKILFENQKDKLEDHFRDRGYDAFLAARPMSSNAPARLKKVRKSIDDAPGIAASAGAKRDYYEDLINFTSDQLKDPRCCPFPRTLNQLANFNILVTKPSDAAVSVGYLQMLIRQFVRPPMLAPPRDSYRISELLDLAPL